MRTNTGRGGAHAHSRTRSYEHCAWCDDQEEIRSLKQPGDCGKHPAACLVERPMKAEHGNQSTTVTAARESICTACESERQAVEQEQKDCISDLRSEGEPQAVSVIEARIVHLRAIRSRSTE